MVIKETGRGVGFLKKFKKKQEYILLKNWGIVILE